MANASILAAFERMWQHVVAALGNIDEKLDNTVHTTSQNLTEDQKLQARENIDAISGWSEMDDKPFGETSTGSDTLTWDGNREGLVRADDYEQYLISESTPTLDDFANGASNIRLSDGVGSSTNLELYSAIYEAGDGCIVVGNSIVALRDGATLGDTTYPKKGTYFTWIGNNDYTASLTINGYNGFPTFKKISAEYMPDDYIPVPSATTDDNGKVLKVVDGSAEWSEMLSDGGGDITIDLENANEGEINTINADTLGGKLESDLSVAKSVDSDSLGGYASTDYVRYDELGNHALTSSNVVNNLITAEEGYVADARTVYALNNSKLSMDLLWENASIDSTFGAQTIAVDLTQYSHGFILYKNFNTEDSMISAVLEKNIVVASYGFGGIASATSASVCMRTCQMTDSGLVFTDAKNKAITATTAGTSSNARMVPVCFYGLKGAK